MTAGPNKHVLRLPKRHARKATGTPDPQEGRRLVRAQSPRAAITASLIVIIVFNAGWAVLSVTTGRVFPWMTVLQALVIGLAVRRAGCGLDWRFPAIAATATVLGALTGNIVVGAAFTAAELGTGTLTVLGAVTSMTWPVFFDEVMTAADLIYALFGAGLAAFYANRRIDRDQYLSLRTWQREQGND